MRSIEVKTQLIPDILEYLVIKRQFEVLRQPPCKSSPDPHVPARYILSQPDNCSQIIITPGEVVGLVTACSGADPLLEDFNRELLAEE